jgi:hypothetical protein
MPLYHLTLTLRDQGRARTIVFEHPAGTIGQLASHKGFVEGLDIHSGGRAYPIAINMDHVVRIGPYVARGQDDGAQP